MSSDSEGRKIHGLAEQARERGEFLEALKLLDEALIIYQKSGDYLGLSESLGSRFLTLKHLYGSTNDDVFMTLSKNTAICAVEIAKNKGQKEAVSRPLFHLGQAYESLGEFSKAVEAYKESIEKKLEFPSEFHERPGVLADMKVHLHTCEYKSGDKGGYEKALEALADLEKSDEPKYNKDVWMSGAHMRMAEMLYDFDKETSKEHLFKAKAIIDSNSDLKLRLGQWLKLAERLTF